jgi:tetratricopeptide (TPR) repeat protein
MDNSTNNMSEKLVQYLDGELAGVERNNLQQLLVQDSSLQTEFENFQATREAVRMYGLHQQVAGVHSQMMQEMQAPVKQISSARRIFRYSIAVAASVILIAAGIWGYNFYTLSSNKVFASNYHSYELSTLRDIDPQQLSPVEKAYRDKDYKRVVELNSQNQAAPVKETFLTAMAMVELKENTKAIDVFKKVIAEDEAVKTDLFKDEAEYYLALTYIRDGDYDFALELLRNIKNDPAHLYNGKVTGKLIRQVKMLKWR